MKSRTQIKQIKESRKRKKYKILKHGKIKKHNCTGLCAEEICDKRQEYFIKVDWGGFKFFTPLCKEHYEKAMIQETWREEGYFKKAEGNRNE